MEPKTKQKNNFRRFRTEKLIVFNFLRVSDLKWPSINYIRQAYLCGIHFLILIFLSQLIYKLSEHL